MIPAPDRVACKRQENLIWEVLTFTFHLGGQEQISFFFPVDDMKRQYHWSLDLLIPSLICPAYELRVSDLSISWWCHIFIQ